MPTAFEVREPAFDFGAGGLVIAFPSGVLATVAGICEDSLVATNAHCPPGFSCGATGTLHTRLASRTEKSDTAVVAVRADYHAHARRAGHRGGFNVNIETVFAVEPAPVRGRLSATTRVDTLIAQELLKLPAAIATVSIHHRTTLELINKPATNNPSIRSVAVCGIAVCRVDVVNLGGVDVCRVAVVNLGGVAVRSVSGVCRVDVVNLGCVDVGGVDVCGVGVLSASSVGGVGEVFDELFGGGGVCGVASGDGGVGDQLAVGVNRDVAFVTVETPGAAFVRGGCRGPLWK